MTDSLDPVDNRTSAVHLLDTAKHHLGHAIRHLDRLADTSVTDPQTVQFNAEHAAKHAVEAADHLQRGFDYLTEVDSPAAEFKAEHDRLTAARSDIKKGARKGMSDFIKSMPRKGVV